MPRIVVFHASYGCDTGCCGHVVQLGDERSFDFTHPYGQDHQKFVRDFVTAKFGDDHVADIDWDRLMVVDD